MLIALGDSVARSVDECFDRRRLCGAGEYIPCAFNTYLVMVACLNYGIVSARRGSMEDNARFDDCQEFRISSLLQMSPV